MSVADTGGVSTSYNRLQQLKSFDESKAGVKGLVDSGITKLPQIFIRPPEELAADNQTPSQFTIPVIDLKGVSGDHSKMVAAVREAADTVGCSKW
ncbi:hypothetical protein S83_052974 [Arachis hypogaea]